MARAKEQGRKGGAREELPPSGRMTVREAGHKGGQKVKELIERGKQRASGS
jgi:hypothetical protein